MKITVKNDMTTKMPSCLGALPIELLFRERCVVQAGSRAWYLGSDPALSFTTGTFLSKSSVVSAAKRGFDDMMHVKFSHSLWYHVNASERLLLLD